MLIPTELLATRYDEWSLERLFKGAINKKYLTQQVRGLLISPSFLLVNWRYTNMTARQFADAVPADMSAVVGQMIESQRMPNWEDEDYIAIPRDALAAMNKSFIHDACKNIVAEPSMLLYDFYNFNSETGKVERTAWDYDASSYSDGTWHPEHLFLDRRTPKAYSAEQVGFAPPRVRGTGKSKEGYYISAYNVRNYDREGDYDYEDDPVRPRNMPGLRTTKQ